MLVVGGHNIQPMFMRQFEKLRNNTFLSDIILGSAALNTNLTDAIITHVYLSKAVSSLRQYPSLLSLNPANLTHVLKVDIGELINNNEDSSHVHIRDMHGLFPPPDSHK